MGENSQICNFTNKKYKNTFQRQVVRNTSHGFPWVTTTFLTPYEPYGSYRIGPMSGFGVLCLQMYICVYIMWNLEIDFWKKTAVFYVNSLYVQKSQG